MRSLPSRARRLLALALPATLVALGPLAAGCLAGGEREPDGSVAFEVAIEGPAEANVGDTVTLLGRADGIPDGSAFWFWDFGDGIEHQDVGLDEVEHEFSAAGAYVVTLTVVNADGERAVARHALAVNQEFGFEGTVAAANPLGMGDDAWSSAFPVGPGAVALEVDASFQSAGLLPEPVAGLVTGGAPDKVIVRILAPENANATAGRNGDVVLLEVILEIGPEGKRLRAEVPGERFHAPSDIVFEVTPESGTVRFTATVRVTYGG